MSAKNASSIPVLVVLANIITLTTVFATILKNGTKITEFDAIAYCICFIILAVAYMEST